MSPLCPPSSPCHCLFVESSAQQVSTICEVPSCTPRVGKARCPSVDLTLCKLSKKLVQIPRPYHQLLTVAEKLRIDRTVRYDATLTFKANLKCSAATFA